MFMAAQSCPWDSIERFVSLMHQYNRTGFTCLCTVTHLHVHTLWWPHWGHRPHYHNRLQSCRKRVSVAVGPETKPWHGVTLTNPIRRCKKGGWDLRFMSVNRMCSQRVILQSWCMPAKWNCQYYLYLCSPTYTHRPSCWFLHLLQGRLMIHLWLKEF